MPCKTLHFLLIIQLAVLPKLFSQTSEQVRDNLYAVNADGTYSLYDGNLTAYSTVNSNAIDGMDAVKMSNFGENLGLLRGTTTLAIERRQSIATSDTIFFRMWNMHQKTYKLELLLTGLNRPGFTGVLEDAYLNTATGVNLNGTTNATFTITSDPASAKSTRFRLIVSSPLSVFAPLPVTFTGVKAYEKNENVNVEWTVENEKNILEYQIQKSTNGGQFTTASTIVSKGNNSSIYAWTDFSSVSGSNFYRISSIDINGHAQYSNVIKVMVGLTNQFISVYPNPVVNGTVNLQLTNQPKGIYEIRLFNNFGQLLHVTQLKHEGGSSTQTIQVNKNIGKGNYELQISRPDNTRTNIKTVIQ
jgi:hypothetical protein